MVWFLRKSFKLGPLRFNLSKSGVGVSAGVKGARVGVDARGRSYVHAGRGGLYFRRSLSGTASGDEDAALPEFLRPRLPWTLTLSIAVLVLMFFVQFQREVCAVLNFVWQVLGKRWDCEARAPAFGSYFWPAFGIASLLAIWAVVWAVRRDARIEAWLRERAIQEHRPLSREELRSAMKPDADEPPTPKGSGR